MGPSELDSYRNSEHSGIMTHHSLTASGPVLPEWKQHHPPLRSSIWTSFNRKERSHENPVGYVGLAVVTARPD